MSDTSNFVQVCFRSKCDKDCCHVNKSLFVKNGVHYDSENSIWTKINNDTVFRKTSMTYVQSNRQLKQTNPAPQNSPTPSIQIPKENINLCFVGGVSTGKSTILNAIFSEQLTQCKIKRTTMVPTIYIENPDQCNPFDKADITERIYAEIAQKNKEIIELTEQGLEAKYDELVFNVGKLDINILDDCFVNVYDIPGLNDARTEDVYYKYLDDNFHQFNLIILLVDIHSGLNTSDEMDMLRFVASHMRHHKGHGRKTYTLVVVNKADDMQWNEDTQSLELTGELSEMYEQTEKTVIAEFDAKGVKDQLIGILPLCAADSYLYRMVKKHGAGFHLTPDQVLKIGVNQMGKRFSKNAPDVQKTMVDGVLGDKDFVDDMIKLSGFQTFVDTLSAFLRSNGTNKQIRIDNILFEIKKLPSLSMSVTGYCFNDLVKQRIALLGKIAKIDKLVFDGLMRELLATLKDLLNTAIKTYRTMSTELIVFYQNFKKCVLDIYFTEYDDAASYNVKGFSQFFVEHMMIQIYAKLAKGGYFVDDYLEVFNTLICIGTFDPRTVDAVLSVIVKNQYPVKYMETTAEMDAFIGMLTQIKSIGVDMTAFLRHILMERYMGQDEYSLIKKYLSYVERGDIVIRTFMTPTNPRAHRKQYVEWCPDEGLDILDWFYFDVTGKYA